jgi:hypothetical protein
MARHPDLDDQRLLGLATSIIGGFFPVPLVVGGALGLVVGLVVTRVKYVPEDD